MRFKAIKQHYDIGYIVAIYNEEKYGGDCICIGSGFVHGLIAINIETGKVFYSSLVTPGENSEIGQLAARIKADEKNGVLRALIDEPDTFARNLPVFTTENWAVKAEQCEEYGWPNTTHTGRIMYENTYFRTRAEAYADTAPTAQTRSWFFLVVAAADSLAPDVAIGTLVNAARSAAADAGGADDLR